jgi:hypothetical protein
MENKLQGMVAVLETRVKIYQAMIEEKIKERDSHSVTGVMYQILDSSKSNLEGRLEATQEALRELQELMKVEA